MRRQASSVRKVCLLKGRAAGVLMGTAAGCGTAAEAASIMPARASGPTRAGKEDPSKRPQPRPQQQSMERPIAKAKQTAAVQPASGCCCKSELAAVAASEPSEAATDAVAGERPKHPKV